MATAFDYNRDLVGLHKLDSCGYIVRCQRLDDSFLGVRQRLCVWNDRPVAVRVIGHWMEAKDGKTYGILHTMLAPPLEALRISRTIRS